MKPKLIIHGGAWNIPDIYEAAHIIGIKKALNTVYPLLKEGMNALDAVEKAVNILEEDETFDAGKGAFLNKSGEIELDAIIVDGTTINFGAVGGVRNVLHPITLARKVMDNTEHCFLVGKGANIFAESQGINILPSEDLLTDRELEYHEKIKVDPNFRTHYPFALPKDTVGAVAMDCEGNFAAGTSTGGTPRKLPGRVGDSPIFGAGAYADNEIGACSTTGWGESIMRAILAKRVIDGLEHHIPNISVQNALHYIDAKFSGKAGIIGITAYGSYFHGYNTPKMAYGYIDDEVVVKVN